MFKSKLLLLIVIASVTLVSCKKESLVAPAVKSSPSDALIKTKTEGNLVETYFYDNQKRVSKIVFSSITNSDTYYYEYTYSNGMVSEYHSNENRHELEETVNGVTKIYCTTNPVYYKLNSQGYFQGNTSGCEEKSFSYDKNGFVVEQNIELTDFSKNESIKNDNYNITAIKSSGFSYLGGNFTTTTEFTYLTDKVNSIGNKNFGKNFLGKSAENLVEKESENNQKINYTYEFDTEKRVINRKTTKNNSQITSAYTYY